jgi:hypothetical protein
MFEPASEVGLVAGGAEASPLMRPIIIHGAKLRLDIGKISAPFGGTLKNLSFTAVYPPPIL